MDDYRDIVAAGFAVFCAALMLVAWLLWISHKPERGNSDLRMEPSIAATQSIPSSREPSVVASMPVWR
jgi:hypothetical protein